MTPIIRTYQSSDKTACIAAFTSNIPLFFAEHELAEFDAFLDNFHRPNANDKGYITTYYDVIELEGNVIACGGYGCKDGGKTVSLAWGLVHREWHKKGWGKMLLEHRLAQIAQRFPDLPFVLDTTQHSYAFFEKFGFVVTQVTTDFYEKGLDRYDMVYKI